MWPDLAGVEGVPDALWLAGRETLLALPLRIAIVGTRSPSPYGEAQARRFADAFARAGALVVSGLARGVDAAAHRAVLDAGGATAAVLGSSVDRPWPQDALTERMGREGLLLSEFAPGTSPRRHHFPLRNRLISGLVQAVVVIEAAYRSGSLITARWAADQGRRVYALPGRVDHPMARGCHRILREGAELVEDPEDVLHELGVFAPDRGSRPSSHAEPPDAVLGALTGETLLAEEVAQRTGVSLPEALARLAELELEGRVQRAPGALYRLAVRGG